MVKKAPKAKVINYYKNVRGKSLLRYGFRPFEIRGVVREIKNKQGEVVKIFRQGLRDIRLRYTDKEGKRHSLFFRYAREWRRHQYEEFYVEKRRQGLSRGGIIREWDSRIRGEYEANGWIVKEGPDRGKLNWGAMFRDLEERWKAVWLKKHGYDWGETPEKRRAKQDHATKVKRPEGGTMKKLNRKVRENQRIESRRK